MQNYPFQIGDGIWLQYLAAEEELGLTKYLYAKQFKVADTPLSYRQINELDKDNLIHDERDSDKGWRKFSLFDLIFLNVVGELKSYGVKHDKLNLLKDSFFKPHKKNDTVSKFLAEQAIGCAIIGAEITLVFHSDGSLSFCDPAHYALFNKDVSRVHINLNEVINRIRKSIGQEAFPVHASLSKEYVHSRTLDVTPKEQEVLRIIRNDDFRSIQILKKNGGTYLIHAERSNGKSDMTVSELANLLKERDFQKITITQTDGKVVSLKVEETVKL